MDYPIEPIGAIVGRGQAARRRSNALKACPYAAGTVHWHCWNLGYLGEALEDGEPWPEPVANEVVA